MDNGQVFLWAFFGGLFLGWLIWWTRYRVKLETVQLVLAETVAENARLKISMAAGVASGDARQIYLTTQSALMCAFPDKVKAAV